MPRRGKGSKADLEAAALAAKESVEAVEEAASEGDEDEFDDALADAQKAIGELKEQVKWLKDNFPKEPQPDPDLPNLKETLRTATETIKTLQTQVKELTDKASQEPPKKTADSTTTVDLQTPGIKAPLPPTPQPADGVAISTPPAIEPKKTEVPSASAVEAKRKFRLI